MYSSRFITHPRKSDANVIIIFSSPNYNNIALLSISHLFREILIEISSCLVTFWSIIGVHISIMNTRLSCFTYVITNKTSTSFNRS